MASSPEKTHSVRPPVATPAPREGFFRRAGDAAFFGTHEARPFFARALQAKLEVSQPDDPQEKEADAVAETVMRAEATNAAPAAAEERDEGVQCSPVVQRAPTLARLSRQEGAGGVPGHASAEDDIGGDLALQPKAEGVAAPLVQRNARAPPAPADASHDSAHGFESTLATTKGSGSGLPNDVRQTMEQRFGADFAGVRVHTGSAAEHLSGRISAQAFTHGSDIYFNSGRYDPGSATGGRLLAHELTHTIQQGASPARADAKLARSIQRKGIARSLQRSEAGSQRAAAVELAKAEQGKVAANQQGPDGKRTGWERLLEYFKTAFGPDKILPEGAAYQQGHVHEGHIKTPSTFNGDVRGGDGRTVQYNQPRDAMPSWCGIFAFWALNKGGIPLRKWLLGGSVIPPEAAYPANHQPQPGDIAYRPELSHYALVASSDGSSVTSINGDTAGGEIQVQTHPREHWFGFFDPSRMTEGPLRAPGSPDAPGAVRPRSLRELRKQIFNVDRSPELGSSMPAPQTAEKDEEQEKLQAKSEDVATSKDATAASGGDADDEASSAQAGAGVALARSAERGRRLARTAAGPPPGPCTTTAALDAARDTDTTPGHVTSVAREPLVPQSRGPPQRAPPLVQSSIHRRIQRGWLGNAWDAVSSAVSDAAAWVEKGLDAAKEWLLDKVRNFVSGIPGYKLLCLILGSDPITGAATPLTGANLLEAGLDILPSGSLFRFLLNRLGIYANVATWLGGRIDELTALASGVEARFATFWDGLSLDRVGNPDGVLNDVAELLRGNVSAIVGFVERSASTFLDMIKRVMVREIAAFVRTRIPRLYPLLTVALGFDPETLQEVPRNGTNILNAFLEVSEDGAEQKKQLLESGTFQRIADWIDRGIAVFGTAWTMLKAGIAGIWDFATVENLFSPIETLTKIYDTFAPPIAMVTQFMVDAALEVLRVIKDALLAKLSAYARTTRGFPLLCVIIGKDPFTGVAVPRTVHNVVKGFMSLMDGGEQQYEQLKESGAIDRIVAKVEAAVARLELTPAAIVQLYSDLWNSFSIRDLARPLETFGRIVATFGQPILRLIRFVIEIVVIVVEAVLILMSFPFDLIANIIAKARQAFERIKQDVSGFLKNLLRAIKQGFVQFFDNITRHLMNGLVGWLVSELRDAGVPVLTDFSLRGVISWVLEVLGISMEKIWQKLAAHPRIGAARVAKMRGMVDKVEGIWTFIKDVQERGMAAIWDKIQEQLSNLWDTVLDAVKNWIMQKIITVVVTKLLSLLDPTGIMAIVNSTIALYKAIQSFIKYMTEMLRVVSAFAEGVLEIAEGNVTRAADFLENAMDRAMPVVIGFLANQVGLGGIGRKVGELIGKAQDQVDAALTWLVNKAVDTGFALLDRAVALGRSAVAALTQWWKGKKEFTGADAQRHEVFFEGDEANAVLTIQSKRQPYSEFLLAYEEKLKAAGEGATKVSTPQGDKTREDVLVDAKAVACELDTARAERTKANTEEETDRKETAKKAAVAVLLNKLATASIPLFGSMKPKKEEINLRHEPGNKFAKTMVAENICNGEFFEEGAPPSHDPYEPYDAIDPRRNRDASYYIRGHLLNEKLGGPGSWNNMTPLTRSANTNHELKVESKVKAAFNIGAVIRYEVTPVGNTSPKTTPLEAKHKDEFTRIRDFDRYLPVLQEIIENEKEVCTTLVCKASTRKYERGQWVEDKVFVNEPIVNKVETEYSSYELGDNTPPATINLNTDNWTELDHLMHIGETRAMAIVEYRKKCGPFQDIDALITVPGIGGKTIDALKKEPKDRIKFE